MCIKLVFATALIIAFGAFESTEAAKRLPRPTVGAPVQQSVTGGLAFDFKDCTFTSPYQTFSDTESSSGTAVRKLSGNHEQGQIVCPVNVTPGTYHLWISYRPRGVINDPRRCAIWVSTTPFRSGFQNENATLACVVGQPAPPSFTPVIIGANANFATLTQGTAQASFSLGSGGKLYIMAEQAMEFDWGFLSQNPVATPIPPAGAPATGVAFDASGVGDAGSPDTALSWSQTVGSGSNRICVIGVGHRTTTNTISSVASNVDGAFTLFHWFAVPGGNVPNAIYYLLNPTPGAHTLSVTSSQNQNMVANSACYEGVSQASPFGAVTSFSGVGDPSGSIAANGNQLVLSHIIGSIPTAQTITVNAGQTQRWNIDAGAPSQANRFSVLSDKPGDTTVSMGADVSADTNAWVMLMVALNPPSGAGEAPVLGSPQVVSVGPTGATVRASVNDPSALCSAQSDSDQSGEPYDGPAVANLGTNGGFCTIEFVGLQTNTQYWFRINATNDAGTTNGSEGTFNTSSAAFLTAFWTAGEKTQWVSRITNGPYRVAGDVSSNSPGDWTRINSNASTFRSNPTAEVWAGKTTAGCATNANPGQGAISWSLGDKIRDAGFRYFLQGDTADRDAVRDQLLSQAGQAGTQFGDGSKWCVNDQISPDGILRVNTWLTRLVLAYDFIRADISAGNRTTLDAWFLATGNYLEALNHHWVSKRFPSRKSDVYTTSWPLGNSRGKMYFGGPDFFEFHAVWDNQFSTNTRTFALIGVLLSNSTLKTEAKRWVKEYLKYGVWYTNTGDVTTPGELYRWGAFSTTNIGLGWNYPMLSMGAVLTIADTLARTGDFELYSFSTTDGHNQSGGGPKTIQAAATTLLQMTDHSIIRYGSGTSTTNPNLIIDNFSENNSTHWVWDVSFARANQFFKSAYWSSIYLRQGAGTLPYPSGPSTFGGNPFQGEWNIYPGALFMFGQMEGVVNPYPGGPP